MPWRKVTKERPPLRERLSNPLVGALILAIVVLLLMVPTIGDGVFIGLGDNWYLSQGLAAYGEEEVTFTFICITPTHIDIEDLQAEFVLLSGGSVVSVTTSNESISSDDPVIPELRLFENVSVPHLGHDQMSLGFILTLTYKGKLADQYYFDRIPWDE